MPTLSLKGCARSAPQAAVGIGYQHNRGGCHYPAHINARRKLLQKGGVLDTQTILGRNAPGNP